MTTAAHQLLDHLLDDLKKELFEKMHQNIVLELEKQKRNLQNMVAEMLTERKGEMLVVMMNKVHREIMKEQEKIMKEQEKIMKEQEKEGLMDLRCKSQHVRTRQTMLRSGSAVFPGTAGKHSASAASGRQTSKEDPQRDNWKTLFESLF